jgi:hypothetical protein
VEAGVAGARGALGPAAAAATARKAADLTRRRAAAAAAAATESAEREAAAAKRAVTRQMWAPKVQAAERVAAVRGSQTRQLQAAARRRGIEEELAGKTEQTQVSRPLAFNPWSPLETLSLTRAAVGAGHP